MHNAHFAATFYRFAGKTIHNEVAVWHAGYVAGKHKVAYAKNPYGYPPYSPPAREWHDGWTLACQEHGHCRQ